MMTTEEILCLVKLERKRQEDLRRAGKFPWSCSDVRDPSYSPSSPIMPAEKLAVLAEEFGEVADIVCKMQAGKAEGKGLTNRHLREELIQVAAVAVAWAESLG